jgi:hypothetical protein
VNMTEQIDGELQQQQRVVEFEEEVERAIEAWVSGRGPYLEQEHRARAGELGYDPERVGRAWVNAKQTKLAMAAPKVEVLKRRNLDSPPQLKVVGGRAIPIVFDKREFKEATKPPTIDEKEAAFKEMAKLWTSDPIAYAKQKEDWADKLAVTQTVIERAVKVVRDKEEEGEQSQTTKLVAIGVGDNVQLWHAPDGFGYATVWINGHWENHRMDQTSFGRWLRAEYGRLNICRVGGEYIPQTVSAQALRDAISTLEGVARFHREERPQPVFRVGGDTKTIWLDLGRPDWSAVEITAEGWWVREKAGVSFLRTDQILPLPKPMRGGSINALQGVLNVRPSQFVLAVAWLLQALNPVGDYPLVDAEGPSEAGKSAACKKLLRSIHPTKTELRKAKKVDDLLIAAKNDWVLGFDNMSYMSADWSDTLCMISTGISSGTRAHYTNDEEHVYTVQRPVIFNGIPSELTERPDLVSRTIKLDIPPIKHRRGNLDLEEEFVRIWPEVLGALLDGLAAALRNWRKINVEDIGLEPARLMDFEKFAEAGCRAMGFEEWDFVNTYAANRRGMMVAAAEASAVGRAVVAFLRMNPKGFEGKMSGLLQALQTYRGDAGWRDWPKDPTRLSSELRRLIKPLSAIGITCATKVDRRGEAGTQKDVVIKYAPSDTCEKGQEACPSMNP